MAEDTADAPPADDGKRDDADEANAADDDGDDEEKRPTATDGSVESAGSALPEFKLSLSDSDEDAAAAATATAAQTTADGDRKTDRLSALARHFKQLKRGLVRGAADEAPLAPQPPKQPPQRQLRAGGPGQALAAADPHGRALEVKEEDFERLHALERRLRRIHRDIKEQRCARARLRFVILSTHRFCRAAQTSSACGSPLSRSVLCPRSLRPRRPRLRARSIRER